MEQKRFSIKQLTSASALLFLLAMTGCSGSSDGQSQSGGIASCDGGNEPVACISDVESIASDTVEALDDADGGDPGEMSSGACARSASDGGPWSICVVPIDDGQVVVGRDAGDGLSVRVRVQGIEVAFPLDNVSGSATVLNGTATTFDVVDVDGVTVGGLSGPGLIESGS